MQDQRECASGPDETGFQGQKACRPLAACGGLKRRAGAPIIPLLQVWKPQESLGGLPGLAWLPWLASAAQAAVSYLLPTPSRPAQRLLILLAQWMRWSMLAEKEKAGGHSFQIFFRELFHFFLDRE